MRRNNSILKTVLAILAPMMAALGVQQSCYAESGVIVSPMYQKVVLLPGEENEVTFTVANPSDATDNLEYELELQPFSAGDENSVSFVAKEDYSQILDWIVLKKTEGELEPNEKDNVVVTINVPEDAPAGGQYAAVIVKTKNDGGALINQVFAMSHLIYAEVAGETIRKGDIKDVGVPGFLFSGSITGSAIITNMGNVHSEAKHILRVLPLIGSEEYYTNEEDPQSNLIMPGASRYTSVSWDNTPSVGIFRVIYSVEYEGVQKELRKVVIVCPIWLLLVIIMLIVLIIAKLVLGKRRS